MTTIICAVDGSTASATALEAASLIAERTNAKLLVATVMPLTSAAKRAQQIGAGVAVATSLMRTHADIEQAEAVPLIGDPAIELASLATETGASMIIVGARGKGRGRTTFRSQLQRKLAEMATVPVVIAPSAPRLAPVPVDVPTRSR